MAAAHVQPRSCLISERSADFLNWLKGAVVKQPGSEQKARLILFFPSDPRTQLHDLEGWTCLDALADFQLGALSLTAATHNYTLDEVRFGLMANGWREALQDLSGNFPIVL